MSGIQKFLVTIIVLFAIAIGLNTFCPQDIEANKTRLAPSPIEPKVYISDEALFEELVAIDKRMEEEWAQRKIEMEREREQGIILEDFFEEGGFQVLGVESKDSLVQVKLKSYHPNLTDRYKYEEEIISQLGEALLAYQKWDTYRFSFEGYGSIDIYDRDKVSYGTDAYFFPIERMDLRAQLYEMYLQSQEV